MKKRIAIYGAGGLGREILSLLKALPGWEVVGFYDDGIQKGTAIKNIKVLGGLPELSVTENPIHLVIAIGDPKIKSRLIDKLSQNKKIEYPVLIHPSAIIQDIDNVHLSQGVVITAGVILTTEINLGDHVLLNLNCTVGHDVKIGTSSSLMPGVNIAGGVTIEKEVFIGSGANILNGLTIEKQSRIGAGAVVTRNVKQGDTVVGVPANPVSK